MNRTRIALAAVAALVAYMAAGGVFFAMPALREEFTKHAGVFRSGEAMNSVMAIGMTGILLAIVVATVIFAKMHPAGGGIRDGVEYGALLALFQLGGFVLHNHMNLNVSARLTAIQGTVYTVEWLVVGVVISLVYRA